MKSYEDILYDVIDNVAVIRLNRPQTLNALAPRMAEELLDATRRGEREARAMLIGAVGRCFSSGADLAGGGTIEFGDPALDMGRSLDGLINPIIYQMRTAQVPIVTSVRGAAVGVGCGVALAGDIIVAAESAFFYQAFSKVGLSPDGGSAYLLTKAIGRPRAMELMLLGPKLGAAKALEWGLINRLIPDDDLDTASMELATELARGPKSLGIIKRVAWAALDAAFETSMSNERVGQREAGRTEDFAEGVAAFRDRRPPQFTGR